MLELQNENLTLRVDPLGAQMMELATAKGTQLLWNGDEKYWTDRAPVLFPFVGKVNGGFYTHKGVKYPMGQHGFARDNEFECIENTENKTQHPHLNT